MSNYYDSPLNWENVKDGTAFVEKYLGDVVRIIKHLIEVDENEDEEEYILVDYYDTYEIGLKKERKISYDGWLMIGFADWEYVEIPYREFDRSIIRSFVKKHMDPLDDDKTYI